MKYNTVSIFNFQLAIFILIISFQINANAQPVWDAKQLNRIDVSIHPDSLAWLYKKENLTSERYLNADFIYSYTNKKDTLKNIGFRLRGNTSRFAYKKSFKISFNEFVPGRRYAQTKKLNLVGEHNDPSVLRERLYLYAYNQLAFSKRENAFVNVYINNNFYGVYVVLEEYDKDWISKNFADNTGNLYKCTYPADLVYINTNPDAYKVPVGGSSVDRVYNLQTNTSIDDYTRFAKFINAFNLYSGATLRLKIDSIVNVPSVLANYAMDIASGNWDDYAYNKNNFFLYDNPKDGKFYFIPFDNDNTFGIDWIKIDWAKRNAQSWLNSPRPLVSKILSINEYGKLFVRYLDTITNQILDTAKVFPLIDSMHQLIKSSIAIDPFYSKDYGYNLSSFNNSIEAVVDGHTPYGVKPFLRSRSKTSNSFIKIALKNKNISSSNFFLQKNNSILFLVPQQIQSVNIYNREGKLIYTYKKDIPNLIEIKSQPGIYFIQVQSEQGSIKQKIIIGE